MDRKAFKFGSEGFDGVVFLFEDDFVAVGELDELDAEGD